MIDKIRKIDREKMFLLSIIFISSMYILSSTYTPAISQIKCLFYLMRIVSYFLVAVKFILDLLENKYSIKDMTLITIFGLFFAIVSYQTKTIGYLVYYVFIVVGRDVNYEKIIKAACGSFMLSAALIVFLSKINVIEDYIFIQGERHRHGLGFVGATYLPCHLMFIALYYGYLKKDDITVLQLLSFFAINLLIFILTRTKSAFALTNIFLFVLALLKYIKPLRKYYSPYKYISVALPIVASTGICILSYMYDDKIMWMARLNNLLTGRLRLAKLGFDANGISLFARHIIERFDEGYNYIDSCYVRILVIFGIAFYIVFIAYLIYYALLINKKKDIYMLAVFVILIVRATFDAELLSMGFNYFLFLLSYERLRVKEYD